MPGRYSCVASGSSRGIREFSSGSALLLDGGERREQTMGNRDIRSKNVKKPRKKDPKAAKMSPSRVTPLPLVPLVKKPKKETYSEE